MKDFRLGSVTYLKSVAIRVKDRDKMIDFYKNTIGFDLKREENELAILGTQQQGSEMLLLEESPRANAHFGEVKKLNRFSLVIPSMEELAAIIYRIREKNYPIERAINDHGCRGILLKDPEGNKLEIYHKNSRITEGANPEEIDQELLLRQPEAPYQKLSEGSYFETIHLNVLDMAQQRHFLTELLGLTVHEENGLYVLNEEDFHVGLSEAVSEAIALPTHEVLGLDFLKFVIDQESMGNLIRHLKEQAVDFFLDQKQTVLTIYDAIGIEWWFVLEVKKKKIIAHDQ